MQEILKMLPAGLFDIMKKLDLQKLEEIRIRVNLPVILKLSNDEQILNYYPKQDEVLRILQLICDNSIYSFQNQICNGYITIKGGHRVGITGDVVLEHEKVKNISYVYSLNFRIARQINYSSYDILGHVLDNKKSSVYNTLIVGSPGTGKTTTIRDLARVLSNGSKDIGFKGMTVGIVDERGEISAMHRGIPQNDLGIRSDVLNNIKKSIGIEMLVRSMAPQVIIADEIGNEDDTKAILYALCSGVKGIFTAHGDKYCDLLQNPILEKMINLKLFEKIIFLDKERKGMVDHVHIISAKPLSNNVIKRKIS